jgi:hypothetical protein
LSTSAPSSGTPSDNNKENVSSDPATTTSPTSPSTPTNIENIDKSKALPEQEAAQSNWTQYFEKMMQGLGDDYMKRIVELAKQESYTISLRKPTGNKVPDPTTGEEVDEFRGWETKQYSRGKIMSSDYNKVEKLRAQYNKERDPEKIADMLARIYQFLAYCYLEMPYSDFIRTDWDEIKPILDACNFRTVYSLPNSQTGSTRTST